MGIEDKFDTAKDEKLGQAKEAIGDATGNEDLQAEGKADQIKGGLKQAGEKIKDALS